MKNKQMNKIVIGLLITFNFSFGCGCIDTGTAPSLGNQSVVKYKFQDSQIAEDINAIAEDIRTAHRTYENESEKRLIDIRLLLTKQLLLEKEILFNQIMINKIQKRVSLKKGTENIIEMETKEIKK